MNMETEPLLTKETYALTKRYQGSRGHRRHNGAIISRKTRKIIWLGGKPRRIWRIKARPRLRLMVRAPLKLLSKLKNAYANFMVRLAGNVGSLNSKNVFGGKRIPKARQVSKGYSGDAFEARLIFEISKALVASSELYPM